MNKKILAVLMALMMVLTSVAAFAEDEGTTTTPTTPSAPKTSFILTKNYTGTDAPAETFNFAVTDSDTQKSYPLTLSNNGQIALTGAGTGTLTVTVPSVGTGKGQYPATPATYTYTISETAGSTLGTTYSTKSYTVTVYVYNSAAAAGSDPVYSTYVTAKAEGENKTDNATFENVYANSGKTLEVKKQLAGNAAVMDDDDFTITVTFGSSVTGRDLNSVITAVASDTTNVKVTWEGNVATITGIGHNDTVTFSNLPVGATWTVAETVNGGYTDSYDDNKTGTMANADVKTVVTNTKSTNIDTGVNTDNMPYIMLMAFVMILAAAVVLKKRSVNE